MPQYRQVDQACEARVFHICALQEFRSGGGRVDPADVHDSCLVHAISKALPSEPKFRSFDLKRGVNRAMYHKVLRKKRIDK